MYKQIKPLLPTGKIQVTPEESEVVISALKTMGYNTEVDIRKQFAFMFWMPKAMAVSNSLKIYNESWEPLHIFTDYFTTETTN
jgi:hypothetical protein